MYSMCDESKLNKKRSEVEKELKDLKRMHSLTVMQHQFVDYMSANVDDFIECYYEEELE